MIRVMVPLAGLLSCAAPAHAQPAVPAAEAFVRGLYDSYANPDAPGSLDPNMAARTFSPALLGLIQRDRRDHPGQSGKLDSDPVCDCQDPDGLKLADLSIAPLADGRLGARVHLRFASATQQLELVLAKTQAGWRVDDISNPGMKSLRHLLSAP